MGSGTNLVRGKELQTPMPYVTCSRCALTAYTAARWTTTDDCPGCGAPLAGSRRAPPSAGATAAGTSGPMTTAPVGTMGAAVTGGPPRRFIGS